jgi:hypothetical protein
MSKSDELLDRQIKEVIFLNDYNTIKKVVIGFRDAVDVEPIKSEKESRVKSSDYGVKSTHYPHKDFQVAFSRLKEFAFNAMEMNVPQTEKADYAVVGLKISGDLFLNQARVVMILAKKVHRSEKLVKYATPQITLSDEGKFLTWKALKKEIEALIAEAWGYIQGKHEDDDVPLAFQMGIPFKEEVSKPAKKAEAKKSETVKKEPRQKKEQQKMPVVAEPTIMGPQAIA